MEISKFGFFWLTRCVGGHGRGPGGLKREISKFVFFGYEVRGRIW